MAQRPGLTATHWATGTYSWDGTGNVKGIGDSRFVYDEVSRLTLGRVALQIANALLAYGPN